MKLLKAKLDVVKGEREDRFDMREVAKINANQIATGEMAAEQAKRDLELAEQRRIAQENQAKLDAIEAQKRADAQAEAAKQAEIKRQQDEKAKADNEQRQREANKKHKAAINNQALDDLMDSADLTEEQAKLVIKCIVKRLIANVTINY